MRKLLSIILLISISHLKGNSQENSFNDEKGLLFNLQLMGFVDNPRVSPIIGYKTGKIISFTGYELTKYSSDFIEMP